MTHGSKTRIQMCAILARAKVTYTALLKFQYTYIQIPLHLVYTAMLACENLENSPTKSGPEEAIYMWSGQL